MNELESCIDSLGAYAAVRQRLEEMVVAQQKAYEHMRVILTTGVSWALG